MAHDEQRKAKEGDMVRIVEARPLSKNKRWVLKEIVRVSPVAGTPTASAVLENK